MFQACICVMGIVSKLLHIQWLQKVFRPSHFLCTFVLQFKFFLPINLQSMHSDKAKMFCKSKTEISHVQKCLNPSFSAV